MTCYRFRVSTPTKERWISVHADSTMRAIILAKVLVSRCHRSGWFLVSGEPE